MLGMGGDPNDILQRLIEALQGGGGYGQAALGSMGGTARGRGGGFGFKPGVRAGVSRGRAYGQRPGGGGLTFNPFAAQMGQGLGNLQAPTPTFNAPPEIADEQPAPPTYGGGGQTYSQPGQIKTGGYLKPAAGAVRQPSDAMQWPPGGFQPNPYQANRFKGWY